MKILVINCSPVKNGATAEITRLVKEYTCVGNDVSAVCIDDFDIKFCRGCRQCHETAECAIEDDTRRLMEQLAWADRIVAVSPSYWADVPGQFKVFIDRCTPWCNTHEPHAAIPLGKQGYVIALRTGSGMRECQKIIGTIEHFFGHLEIASCGSLGLCGVENRTAAAERCAEIREFCAEAVLR